MGRLWTGIAVGIFSWNIWQAFSAPSVYHITLESAYPYYRPAIARVISGTTLRWHNPTLSPHTITHDGCSANQQCMFDSGPIMPRGTFSVPGLPPGRYSYHCQIHPIMRGEIIVESSAGLPQTTSHAPDHRGELPRTLTPSPAQHDSYHVTPTI